MGKFVKHEECPNCGSRDNLGRYDDGSAWCFGCGYRERADRIPVTNKVFIKDDDDIKLPTDLCNNFPGHVVEWLARYRISVEEALKHGWKYSPYWDQLVFLYRDNEGKVACTQARNFRKDAKTKYYNQGSPSEVLPIFLQGAGVCGELQRQQVLVVTEDAVSAVRVAGSARGLTAPLSDAMPCLGSHLPSHKLVALKGLGYTELVMWLDSDKLRESRSIAQRAKWLGFDTRVVYTELDPKEYSDEEISEYLQRT